MAYPSQNRQIVVLIAVAVITILITVVALYTVMLQNPGNVTYIQTIDIEAYWDTNHTNKVSAIDWGNIEAGTTKNITIYVLNTGNTNIRLSMNTTNWTPTNASENITLSWDYQSQTLSPNQLLKTTLILNVEPNTRGITTFSFDAIISATQPP
ncbi:MAG TPA: hypothetical protein VJ249_08250 [Candidatus Bathyarchaeia archaeon]|nr:hypothetical protein [Candidatus Bathyarchaeia archaeon]